MGNRGSNLSQKSPARTGSNHLTNPTLRGLHDLNWVPLWEHSTVFAAPSWELKSPGLDTESIVLISTSTRLTCALIPMVPFTSTLTALAPFTLAPTTPEVYSTVFLCTKDLCGTMRATCDEESSVSDALHSAEYFHQGNDYCCSNTNCLSGTD